jgi:hypothetical protein
VELGSVSVAVLVDMVRGAVGIFVAIIDDVGVRVGAQAATIARSIIAPVWL